MKHDQDSRRLDADAPAAAAELGIKNANGGSDDAAPDVCLCGLAAATGAHLDRPREA